MNQEQSSRLLIFVCTGNTCRSPMAEALFNHLNPSPLWHAESSGLAAYPGEPASALASAALQMDFGLSLDKHRSRPLTRNLLETADLILTMTVSQREVLLRNFPEFQDKIMTVGEMAGDSEKNIPDPFGQGLPVYQETASALAALIEKIIVQFMENN